MRYDLLIKGGNLYLGEGLLREKCDIAIRGKYIEEIGEHINDSRATTIVDAEGLLVTPSFMDTHMHIDEAFTMDDDDTLSLLAAIDNQNKSNAKYFDWTDDQLLEMMLTNASKVVEMCIVNGTGLLKTNVLYTPAWGTTALKAMMVLKEKYSYALDLRTCSGFPDFVAEELEEACERSEIDFISGYPYMDEEYWHTIDSIFERAKRFSLPIDIHCGESDVPNIDCFMYVLDKIEEEKMQGRVTCGHLTSLSAWGMDDYLASEAISKAARLNLNVITLTSCNLYLSSMNRRGPTRVREFMDAGVNVAIAFYNIRDTFRPFGNCDLLEEALLTAKVHHLCNSIDLRKVFDMITYNAAKNAVVNDYGLFPGAPADLVLLGAPTPEEAIRTQAKKIAVYKMGQLVAENGHLLVN